jgi:hypothetical protein
MNLVSYSKHLISFMTYERTHFKLERLSLDKPFEPGVMLHSSFLGPLISY